MIKFKIQKVKFPVDIHSAMKMITEVVRIHKYWILIMTRQYKVTRDKVIDKPPSQPLIPPI